MQGSFWTSSEDEEEQLYLRELLGLQGLPNKPCKQKSGLLLTKQPCHIQSIPWEDFSLHCFLKNCPNKLNFCHFLNS